MHVKADAIVVPYHGEKPTPHEDAVHEIRNCSNIKSELSKALKQHNGKLMPRELVETSGGELGDTILLYHLRMPELFSNPDLYMLHHTVSAIVTQSKPSKIISMPFLMPEHATPHFMVQIAMIIIQNLLGYWKTLQERDIAFNLVIPNQLDPETDLEPLIHLVQNPVIEHHPSVADSRTSFLIGPRSFQGLYQAQNQPQSSPSSQEHSPYQDKLQPHSIAGHQYGHRVQADSSQERFQKPILKSPEKLHYTPNKPSLPSSKTHNMTAYGSHVTIDRPQASQPRQPHTEFLEISSPVPDTSSGPNGQNQVVLRNQPGPESEPKPEPNYENYEMTTRVGTLIELDLPTPSNELYSSAVSQDSSANLHGWDLMNTQTDLITTTRTRLGKSSALGSTAHSQPIQASDEDFESILAAIDDENTIPTISDTPLQPTFVELGMTSNSQLEALKAENPEAFRVEGEE